MRAPLCTGFGIPSVRPRARSAAARPAGKTIFSTPVSVPVTKNPRTAALLVDWAEGRAERLDREAEVLDHPPVLLGGLARLREVVGREDGVRGVEAERLQRAQVHLAARGEADLPVGADQSEHREHLEAEA